MTDDGYVFTPTPITWPTHDRPFFALFCREEPPRHHFCVAGDCGCPCHKRGEGWPS